MGKPVWLGGTSKPEWIDTGKAVHSSLLRGFEPSDPIVHDILSERGILPDQPGMGFRPQQLSLANAIANNLKARKHGINQAGTGTGKSAAYLVPAIAYALKHNEKVIVATSNKVLQDQLVNKDLPMLAKILEPYWQAKFGRNFKYTQLLGFGNYVCKDKLGDPQLEGVLHGAEAIADVWARQTRTGLLQECELNLQSPDYRALRMAMTTTTQDCHGRKRCPSGGTCHYYTAKDRAHEADIIVVNHALLAGNFKTGSAILPVPGVVIVDEAHKWEHSLREGFTSVVGRGQLRQILKRLQRFMHKQDFSSVCEEAKGFFETMAIELMLHQHKPRLFRADLSDQLKTSALRLVALLGPIADTLAEFDESTAKVGACKLSEWCEAALQMWGDNVVLKPYRCAIEGLGVQVQPVDLAALSRKMMKSGCWQFVSATLATTTKPETRFGYLKRTLGMANPREIDVGSPFDYARQQLCYISRTPYPVRSRGGYDPAVFARTFAQTFAPEYMELLQCTQGRALLLFSSYEMLHAVFHRLGRLPWPTRRQGQGDSDHEVISWFRSTPGAVLFSASLWEGIDVPGPGLSLVVADRLPLLPPDDPIYRERSVMLAREYADEHCLEFSSSLVSRRGMADISLPLGTMQLGQGWGRLIRRGSDRGIAACMDSRLILDANFRRVLDLLPGAPTHDRILRRQDLAVARKFIDWRQVS